MLGINLGQDFLGLSSLFTNESELAAEQGKTAVSIAQVQAQVQSQAVQAQADAEAKKADTIKYLGLGFLGVAFIYIVFKFIW